MMERRGEIKMTMMLGIGGIPRIMIIRIIIRRECSARYDSGVGRTTRGGKVGMVSSSSSSSGGGGGGSSIVVS